MWTRFGHSDETVRHHQHRDIRPQSARLLHTRAGEPRLHHQVGFSQVDPDRRSPGIPVEVLEECDARATGRWRASIGVLIDEHIISDRSGPAAVFGNSRVSATKERIVKSIRPSQNIPFRPAHIRGGFMSNASTSERPQAPHRRLYGRLRRDRRFRQLQHAPERIRTASRPIDRD